jgi:hypothetical protein
MTWRLCLISHVPEGTPAFWTTFGGIGHPFGSFHRILRFAPDARFVARRCECLKAVVRHST